MSKDERLSNELPRPRIGRKGTQMTPVSNNHKDRLLFQGLDHFQRNNPPVFKEGYDLDNAQN
ncbi:hypothetical protein CR513_39051, partial [Mucuna pruriens]